MKILKEQVVKIKELLTEAGKQELQIQVDEGIIDKYDEDMVGEIQWNMIDDGHYVIEQIFDQVLCDGYDWDNVLETLFTD
jgi:hypothetical protein